MVYEVYIDVFFFVNMMLDLWILLIVKRLKHYKSTKLRLAAAAANSAFWLSAYLCMPWPKSYFFRGICYVFAYVGMAYIAFGVQGGVKHMQKALGLLQRAVFLYAAGLFANGIFHYLSLKTRHIWELLLSCAFIYCMIQGLLFVCFRLCRAGQAICAVKLVYNGETIVLDGLWDTGNRLYFEGAGKGVSVIQYEYLEPYLSSSLKERIEKRVSEQEETKGKEEFLFFLPYETVSEQDRVFPVIMAQCMTVERKGECLEYKNPLLALNFQPVSKNGEFQMILTTLG